MNERKCNKSGRNAVPGFWHSYDKKNPFNTVYALKPYHYQTLALEAVFLFFHVPVTKYHTRSNLREEGRSFGGGSEFEEVP